MPAPTTVDPALAMQRVARAPPPAIGPEDILALQRTVGNRLVQGILAHRQRKAAFPEAMVQAKLTVNAPCDRREREADRVAEEVMTQPKAQPAQEVWRTDPTRVQELEGVGENLEYQFDAYFTQRGNSLLDLEGLSPVSRKQLVDYLGVSLSKMDEIRSDEYGDDVKLFQGQLAPV